MCWVGVSILICDFFFFDGDISFFQAINLSLAFCMGTDLDTLKATSQPMAVIFVNSFGQKATLAIWTFVVLAQ